MSRRNYREEERRELLSRYRASGQTRKDFAESAGISITSLQSNRLNEAVTSGARIETKMTWILLVRARVPLFALIQSTIRSE